MRLFKTTLTVLLIALSISRAEGYQILTMEMTAYAPLDPRAKEGVCYSGNRYVTASGQRTTPGISVAMGKSVPFGTWVYIFGFGLRRVDDRGGSIGKGKIDLCVWTQEQAYSIGRREVSVWILNTPKDREILISLLRGRGKERK